MKKKVTTVTGMVVRNFCTFYVLPDWTPTSRKLQNTGILSHFGLGWPLALREILGLGRKRKKMQFPGARGTFEEKIRTPQIFFPGIAQLFYILRFGQPDPHGRDIAKYGVWGS